MNFGDNEPQHEICPLCHGEGYYFEDIDGQLAEVATKCEKCEGDGWVYTAARAQDAGREP